jgi:hypothetical protein
MSISEEIVQGHDFVAMELVKQGHDVNELDDYGFTPLIESVIFNKIKIADLLLEYGAIVDLEDYLGQTALFWSCDLDLFDFCKLMLEYNADPNHPNTSGQVPLVYPLLRENSKITDLLIRAGAVESVARDFIEMKVIGHRFELIGSTLIADAKGELIDVDYEGFILEFTTKMLSDSLTKFFHEHSNKILNEYKHELRMICNAILSSSNLMKLKPKLDVTVDSQEIRKILSSDLVILPVSYEGHAITFVKYKNLLAKCDRGVHVKEDTITIYHVENTMFLNHSFLKDLVFKNKSSDYIKTELPKILNLKKLITLPARQQVSGNCSWANMEAVIPASMFLLKAYGKSNDRAYLTNLKNNVISLFNEWVEWDKNRSINELFENFENRPLERRIPIILCLCNILVQRTDPDVPSEFNRAKKICEFIQKTNFKGILSIAISKYLSKVGIKHLRKLDELFKKLRLNISYRI